MQTNNSPTPTRDKIQLRSPAKEKTVTGPQAPAPPAGHRKIKPFLRPTQLLLQVQGRQ